MVKKRLCIVLVMVLIVLATTGGEYILPATVKAAGMIGTGRTEAEDAAWTRYNYSEMSFGSASGGKMMQAYGGGTTILLDQSFEDEEAGSSGPSGWVITEDSNTDVQVSGQSFHPLMGYKSMKFDDSNTSGYCRASKSFTGQTSGIVTVEFSFKLNDTGSFQRAYLQGDTGEAIRLFMDNGKLQWQDGSDVYHDIISVSSENWYNVKLVVSPGTYKYDIFVGQYETDRSAITLKVKDATFYRNLSINKVLFGSGGIGTGELWVDNVKISKAAGAYSSSLSANFGGSSGTYAIRVGYRDEAVGKSRVRLSVGNPKVLLEENFNGMTSGIDPSGWTSQEDANTNIFIDDTIPGSGNKSMKFDDNSGSGYCRTSKSFARQRGGIVTVEFSFRLNDTGSYQRAFIKGFSEDAVRMYIHNGKLQWQGGDDAYHEIMPISSNTWYNVKIEANISRAQFDIYAGTGIPELKAEDVSFYRSSGSIEGIFFGSGGSGTGDMWIDDVKVSRTCINEWIYDLYSYHEGDTFAVVDSPNVQINYNDEIKLEAVYYDPGEPARLDYIEIVQISQDIGHIEFNIDPYDSKVGTAFDGYLLLDCAPRLGDLDGDGQLELYIHKGTRQQLAYELDGTLMWKYDNHTANNPVRADTLMACADFDGDGKDEPLALRYINNVLKLCILDGETGNVQTSVDYSPYYIWFERYMFYAGYFNGTSNRPWIISGMDYKAKHVFNDSLIWQYTIGGGYSENSGHNINVTNYDADSNQEIFLGYAMYDNNGSLIWAHPEWCHLSLNNFGHPDHERIKDINNDGNMEIMWGPCIFFPGTPESVHKYMVLSLDGNVLWSKNGVNEIEFGAELKKSDGNYLVAMAETHYRSTADQFFGIWVYDHNGNKSWPAMRGEWIHEIDWDGDGYDELLTQSTKTNDRGWLILNNNMSFNSFIPYEYLSRSAVPVAVGPILNNKNGDQLMFLETDSKDSSRSFVKVHIYWNNQATGATTRDDLYWSNYATY